MRTYQNTYYIDIATELEVKPQKNSNRIYLCIQNRSASSIDMNVNTHADSLNGQEIQATQTYEQDRGVVSDYLYIRGRAAATTPPSQQVSIVEGYPD